MRAAFLLMVAANAAAQETALMQDTDIMAHYARVLQLMESATAVTPGLSRAAAPLAENARHAVDSMKAIGNPRHGELHYVFLSNAKAFLALADALPKVYPFPEEGRRQFTELRGSVDRGEAHFRALLVAKEAQLREPDRDNLKRYANANARLGPPQPGVPRVVFLGDSITDGWRLNEYFPGKDYVNRGIGGQITGQMLGRMMADVVNAKPETMVLLAGTNDIARGVTPQAIQDNLRMMAELARANGIQVVIASILPVHDYNKDTDPRFERTRARQPATIGELNKWIESYCAGRGFVYLDYFSAMVDSAGLLKKELADDGLHPNAQGYRVMAPLAEAAVAKARPAPAAPARKRRRGFLSGPPSR